MKKQSWKDITVADFQRIYELEKEDPEDKLLALIALVNGLSVEEVLSMPISRLESHYGDIDFLGTEPRMALMKPVYELNGTKYHVHGKEMLTCQYIDFKQMVPTYYENLPQFLTVFLIPNGHRYGDGYDLDKARQDISTMSIVDARAVAAFFLIRYAISTRLFLRSSERKARRLARRARTEKERKAAETLRERLSNLRQRMTGSAW